MQRRRKLYHVVPTRIVHSYPSLFLRRQARLVVRSVINHRFIFEQGAEELRDGRLKGFDVFECGEASYEGGMHEVTKEFSRVGEALADV